MAARGPAAGSRGSRTRTAPNRGSRGRGTRAGWPRMTGCRILPNAVAPQRCQDRRAGRRTLDPRKRGRCTEPSGLRRTGPRNPDRRNRNRPRPAGSTPDRCRRRTPALPGTRSPAAGNRKARRSPVRTALPAVRLSRRAGRSLVPIRTGPDCSWPHPNGDAALTAIHRHLEPANRSSYTGSLPCLSSSRSMIFSIIATNETLCYLLEQFARQRAVIRRDTLLPGWHRHDAFRALRQVAPRSFAEGNRAISH